MGFLAFVLALALPPPRPIPVPLSTAELVAVERALIVELRRTTADPEDYFWSDATLVELGVLYGPEEVRE
jgi:hypothetical protein